jgi:hypothetical protein
VKLTIERAPFKNISFPKILQLKDTVVSFCKNSNESLWFIKGGEFLQQLRDYQLPQHKYCMICKKENKIIVQQQSL